MSFMSGPKPNERIGFLSFFASFIAFMRIYDAAQQIHEIRRSLFNVVLSEDSSYRIIVLNIIIEIRSIRTFVVLGHFYRQMGILISFWRPILTNKPNVMLKNKQFA